MAGIENNGSRVRWRIIRNLGVLFLAGWVGGLGVLGAGFTTQLSSQTVGVGEGVELYLRFEGGQPQLLSRFPEISNLRITSQRQQSRMNVYNGQASMVYEYVYLLEATQPGEYTIPAMQAKLGGQTVTSQPQILKVVQQPAIPDSDAFLRMTPARTEAFVGEVIPLEVKLFVRDGRAEGIHFPVVPAEGFTLGAFPREPMRSQTRLNNMN